MKILERRYYFIAAIISLALGCQMFMSKALWIHSFRSFPLIPCFEPLGFTIPNGLNFVLITVFLVSLFALVFLKKAAPYLVSVLLVLSCLLVLEDITRFQVWFYQFISMLACLCLIKKPKAALLMILASIYFWSGLHKLNVYFVEDTFSWLMTAYDFTTPFGKMPGLAWATGVFELSLGIGLLFEKTRKITGVAILFFHLIILGILGPFGHDWNPIVWPWNMAMIGFAMVLCWDKEPVSFVERKGLGTYLVYLFFGILPVLNYFESWPEQQSFKMYTGISPELLIYFDKEDLDCLPEWTHKDVFGEKLIMYSLDDYAFEELKVPVYTSLYHFKLAGKIFCDCYEEEKGGIDIFYSKRLEKDTDIVSIKCKDLFPE